MNSRNHSRRFAAMDTNTFVDVFDRRDGEMHGGS